jgi:MazG family protein
MLAYCGGRTWAALHQGQVFTGSEAVAAELQNWGIAADLVSPQDVVRVPDSVYAVPGNGADALNDFHLLGVGVDLIPAPTAAEVFMSCPQTGLTWSPLVVDAKTFSADLLERPAVIVERIDDTPGFMDCWHQLLLAVGRRCYGLLADGAVEQLQPDSPPPAAKSLCVLSGRSAGDELEDFLGVMAALRSPDGGCPWDREQTHKSLKPYAIEEAHEVCEAVDSGDPHKLCDELGDLLLQVVFHARVAEESGQFSMGDVIRAIREKMIRRHPHVFGQVLVESSDDVLKNWDEIKKAEGIAPKSTISKIGRGKPALMQAAMVQKHAGKFGFDWEEISGVWAKLEEEISELKAAESQSEREDETGDLLFTVVNLARFLGVEPETALLGSVNKFKARFTALEEITGRHGTTVDQCSMDQLNVWWEEVKQKSES